MFKTAIIMAGGKGSRMFPVSDYVPKPLIRIHNKPLIDHCIDYLRTLGIEHLYVTYGYKSEMLVSHIEKKVDGLVNTIGKDNAYFLFNTAIKHINEPVLITPCDIILNIDSASLYEECNCSRYAYLVPVKKTPGMNADFLTHDARMRILQINREEERPYCASGLQVCNPLVINKTIAPSDNWYVVWNKMIQRRILRTTNTTALKWQTYDRLDQLMETTK